MTPSKSSARKARGARPATRRAATKTKVAATAKTPAAQPGRRAISFLDPNGFIVVDAVAARLGMSKAQFAETIGVRRETVYRTSRERAPKVQARARDMVEIIARIADWAGGEAQAVAWYRAEPIPAFGGRTAESLVKSGMAAPLRDYLDHIATGGFA